MLKKIYCLDIKNNPLHNVKWYSGSSEIVYDEDHIVELIADGYEIVEIYHIPEKESGLSNFIFAENNNKDQFYLSVDCFENGWNRWGYIKTETKLAIKYDGSLRYGKPTPAIEIIEIEQYIV